MNQIMPFGREISKESLTPILEKQVMLVIGGGLGDEGKGGDAYMLAKNGDYDLLVSSVGGPNAGHTVITDDGRKFVGHNLPGSVVSGKDVFLGQGKYISISGLEKEMQNLSEIGVNSRIFIAEGAHIIFPTFHAELDAILENSRINKIGTTKSGVGPATASRALRSGVTIGQLAQTDEQHIKKDITELLVSLWDGAKFDFEELGKEIIEEKRILSKLVRSGKIEIVPDDFAQKAYIKSKRILIEGSQSPALGMFGGAYPQNTSTDTSFLGNLSPLGITPTLERVGQLLVAKVFPSAVGEHRFFGRISHVHPNLKEKEAQFGEETGEYGATTKRPRMVGFPDIATLADTVRNNVGYITGISLRKIDVIPQFQKIIGFKKLPVIIAYDSIAGKPQFEHISYDAEMLIELYKKKLQDIPGASPLTFIAGFGPEPKNSRIV